MNLICIDCGARKYTCDRWQGGDPDCLHGQCEREHDGRLKSEIERLMLTYSPEEITGAFLRILVNKI